MKEVKKNKGFTLIELLAVIVILAVIALIATPIIIGLIEDSRKSAFKSSLYGVFDATDYRLVQDKNTIFPISGIDVPTLSMNNNKFKEGLVLQDDNGMYLENVTDGKYCGNGYKDKLEITIGNCETDAKWFTFDKNTGTITGYDENGPKEVVIPRTIDGVSVTAVGDSAFYKKKLTKVKLPDTITSIGGNAFQENYLANIIIPNSVITIKMSAFVSNKLENVVISNRLTTIEQSVFWDNQLTSITIPNSVTKIEVSAFTKNLLTKVVIPDSVTTIGQGAFSNNKLTSVIIPNSVTQLGMGVFVNNQLSEDQAFIYNRNNDGTENKKSLNSYGGIKRDNVIIPDGIITIDSMAFARNQLTSITIPNSVTTIESFAFQDNLLTDIVFPDSVINIGPFAFYQNKLINVRLSNYVTEIRGYAFSNNQLANIIIPNSVDCIENYAFANNQLTNVKIVGKSSSNDFATYEQNLWGWSDGYNDSNIIWNATE